MEFRGHKAAEHAAIKASKDDPGTTYYVNWVEDNTFCIDIEPELEDQPGYLNGKLVYPEYHD